MNATDIAKQIDKMTLDELLSAPPQNDLPVAGGDCDTNLGWAARVGVPRDSARFKAMMARLVSAGQAEVVTGLVPYGSGWRRTRLIKSPTLAKLIADKKAHT